MWSRGGTRWAAAAVFVPAALYLAWAAWWFARFGYPVPEVHDEFSYLLAADTFAHGRLANPAPAFPEFFEAIHVLVTPAYASMYPPAQGLWLAFGQVAMGHPWWGAVLSTVLFVAAAGWAALAWMGPGWALGAGMTVLSYVVGTYWSTTYWGGSVAALGGALILGSVGRLRRRWQGQEQPGPAAARWALAAIWSLGCVMAALSRPYSGGILALLSLAELARRLARSPITSEQKRAELFGWLGGAAVPAAAGLLFLLAVNQAAAGSPWVLPYQEHARQYQIRRSFLWQQDRPAPLYRHEAIRAVYEGLLRKDMSVRDKYAEMGRMFRDHYGSLKFNGAGLAAALAWGGAAGLGWVVAMVFVGLAAVLMIVWTQPHYYAPYAAFLAAAVAGGAGQAARRAWWGRKRPWLVALVFAGLLAPRFALLVGRTDERAPFARRRAEIVRELEKGPERHLILVKYLPGRNWREEWVFNGADLEGAKVLWARWHKSARWAEFLSHYRDRKLWVLEADLPGFPLRPYDPARDAP
jgi:hypothetical protein